MIRLSFLPDSFSSEHRIFVPVKRFLLLLIPVTVFFALGSFDGGEKTRAPKTAADLGKMLFFDPILSEKKTISCASCHKPEFAFADNVALSFGTDSQMTTRNTPSAMNLGPGPFFFDGRALTLEDQALGPIANPIEMNLPIDSALARLNRHPQYNKYFRKIFRQPATAKTLGEALAAFQRTLSTADTPFDRYMDGDSTAMSVSAIRGQKIFNEKGKCFDCHKGTDFTLDEFKNVGLFNDVELNDPGRSEFTKNDADIGKFKVPGLRNVAVTGPYMHNGMFKTLREVLDYYNTPEKFVKGSIGTDSLVVPLNLGEQELRDLEAFLHALTDDRFTKEKK